MKKLLFSGCALAFLASAGSGFAADLQRAPVYKAPIVAPVQLWTGFYAGVNVGYSWGRSETTESLTSTTGALLAAGATKFNMNGVIGGGQVGYNWQFNSWVLGLEADFQGSAQKGSTNFLCPAGVCAAPFGVIAVFPGGPVSASFNQSLDWFGTVRGRGGILVTPSWLLYVTGGLAYGSVATNGTISGTNAGVPVAAAFASNSTQVGWTVGAGLEGRIGGNWTGKIEYLHIDLGTVNGGPFITPIVALGGGFVAGNFSSKITDDILRFGLNYQFH